jgi:hypothetical protein
VGGFTNALWLWVPVLIFKGISAFLRTIWKFNLWILQTVSGVPLYYCKPEYRIPGILFGTIGVLSIFNFLFFLMFLGSKKGISHGGTPPMGETLFMGLIGAGLLLFCRFLIRRGAI